MKDELSALEISCIVKELQPLVGSKIDRIFQPKKDELLIQLYTSNKGKDILRVVPGKYFYLTKYKSKSPETPFGYCTYLRKYLNGARLKEIRQMEFERIVDIVFEAKGAELHLVAELFGKGNIILCDNKLVIMSPLETQIWKDRAVKKGEAYKHPQLKYNFLTMKKEDFEELLGSSGKEVVKTLATELGLGGTFAEELCKIAGIDKRNTSPGSRDIEKLFNAAENLRGRKISAVVLEGGGKIKDILPFKLESSSRLAQKSFSSFNEALDEHLTEGVITEEKEEKSRAKNKEIEKLQRIIDMQTEQLKAMEDSAEQNQRKADLIYENYKFISGLLLEIKNAREKYSWDEIKEKAKKLKTITQINEKDGTITIEI